MQSLERMALLAAEVAILATIFSSYSFLTSKIIEQVEKYHKERIEEYFYQCLDLLSLQNYPANCPIYIRPLHYKILVELGEKEKIPIKNCEFTGVVKDANGLNICLKDNNFPP